MDPVGARAYISDPDNREAIMKSRTLQSINGKIAQIRDARSMMSSANAPNREKTFQVLYQKELELLKLGAQVAEGR
jgi:hypothetical protein